MWNKFLIWLGVREAAVEKTLDQLHADATKKAESALGTFRYAVSELEKAADNLKNVSAQADEVAKLNAARAAAAIEAAVDNLAVADKIKALIS